MCEVPKYRPLPSVRHEEVGVPRFHLSALESRTFAVWQLDCCVVFTPLPTYECIIYDISGIKKTLHADELSSVCVYNLRPILDMENEELASWQTFCPVVHSWFSLDLVKINC